MGWRRRIKHALGLNPRRRRKRKWIQAAINPAERGELRDKIMRRYGRRAFTSRGTIKTEYLHRIKISPRSSTETKQQANLALRLRRMS